MLGTHQGAVEEAHLPRYLNEFVFRFNRRTSRSRGLVFYRVLELAVAHEPVRYRDLIAHKLPRAVPPLPPRPAGTRRAWNAVTRIGPGEPADVVTPVAWISPIKGNMNDRPGKTGYYVMDRLTMLCHDRRGEQDSVSA